ncbi:MULTISPECIES: glycosyltransferase family 2 protein [unclassified Synechococcus]|uniref:glycosyltransferase family 2 protein n=1 Tax=unclassified Synechococcus TaxID=2626047 RepID=UPI001C22249F|nr:MULTISPECIES: glycosyltransferase family 2 protein [unclassified Synechococcus]
MEQHPLVTVGMPTYNRPASLQRALDSIRSQTYRHLEIVVSDNASPDPEVGRLIANVSHADPRIRHYVQQANVGPSENFAFVLRQARGAFFMWAADDDEWHPAFIEKLLRPLITNPKSGLSFCDFDVRYPDGSLCKDYGSFYDAYREFLHDDGASRVTHYALQAPERGKANLIYGLFRREALIDASVTRFFNSAAWGADMLFVCDVLSRWSFNLAEERLYNVGIPFPASETAVQGCASEPQREKHHRWRLMASHLKYFFVYIRIMAITPDSNPVSFMSFLFRLLPLVIRRMKLDLA